ncbi:MAG: tetratricopeptide repeat protein, partial [Armatimonadota bacterium]
MSKPSLRARVACPILVVLFLLGALSSNGQSLPGQPAPLFGPAPQKQSVPPAVVQAQKRFQKGVDLQKAGKLDAAAAEYRAVLKVAPKFIPALNNLALIYLQKKQAAEAESTLRRILAIDPKSEFALSQMSRVLMARGKTAEALKYARSYAKLKPKDPGAQFILGVICLQTKDFSSAAAAFRSVLHIKPDDLAARYNLGFAYVNLKKYREAQSCMDVLLKK